MTQSTETIILDSLREMREQVSELYTLIKGNGRPGLRQTQDELTAMRAACHEHRAMVAEAQRVIEQRRDSWAMFLLRPLWPVVIGLVFFGLLHAVSNGRLPL